MVGNSDRQFLSMMRSRPVSTTFACSSLSHSGLFSSVSIVSSILESAEEVVVEWVGELRRIGTAMKSISVCQNDYGFRR
jgi:hypothetical protein